MRKENKVTIVIGIIIVLIFICSAIIMSNEKGITQERNGAANTKSESSKDEIAGQEKLIEPIGEEKNDIDTDVVVKKVDSTTGLLIGLDASRCNTDVLMVVNFDAETNELKFVSIPRDLEIDYRIEPFKSMRLSFNDKVNNEEVDANLHQRSYSKINAIYGDTGKTIDSLYYTKAYVEEITGLDIEYLAVLDVYSFIDVVDVIGGVEFYVPEDMKKTDEVQDLYIDLKEGLQVLDGEHAMQLVRYREYKRGDLERIEVQQAFILETYKKLATIKDVGTLISVTKNMFDSVDSNFGINVVLDYVEYIFELDYCNLMSEENMVTIPSWGVKEEYVSNGESKSVYHQYWDPDEARRVVEELIDYAQ